MRKKTSRFHLEKFTVWIFAGALALFSGGLAMAITGTYVNNGSYDIIASSTLMNAAYRFIPSTTAAIFSFQGINNSNNAYNTTLFNYYPPTGNADLFAGTLSYVKSTGYIGIGTSSPTKKFQVADSNTNGTVVFSVGAPGNGYANSYGPQITTIPDSWVVPHTSWLGDSSAYFGSDGTYGAKLYGDYGTTLMYYDQTVGHTNFYPGLYVNSYYKKAGTTYGDIGVNTTVPNAKLDVEGFTNAYGGLGAGLKNGVTINAAANNDSLYGLYVNPTFANGAYTNVKNYAAILMGGNVGIGTTSPQAALEVYSNGNVLIDNQAITPSTPNAAITYSYLVSSLASYQPIASSSSLGSYVTSTASVTGSNSGYSGANTSCAALVSGSHICSVAEVLNTINKGSSMPTANVWIASGPPGYTVNANDCNGRTDGTTNYLGVEWYRSTGNGFGGMQYCNFSMSIACCK